MKSFFVVFLVLMQSAYACDVSSLIYSEFTTNENPSEISKQYMRIGEVYCHAHDGLSLFGVYECPKDGFEVIYVCKNDKAFLFGGHKSSRPFKKIFISS